MYHLRQKIIAPTFRSMVIACRSKTDIIADIEKDPEVSLEPLAEDVEREAVIQKRRNKSRLNYNHYNMMHDKKPFHNASFVWTHETIDYNMTTWAKYGEAVWDDFSPKMCWPTKKEIESVKDYERVAFPYTIESTMEEIRNRRQFEKERTMKRDADIDSKVQNIEKWKIALKARIQKKMQDARDSKAKKDRLVEEVRRHFGFNVSPSDERFQEMLLKREKEQKKKEKELKRSAKEAQAIAKLQQKNIEISKESEKEAEKSS